LRIRLDFYSIFSFRLNTGAVVHLIIAKVNIV